MPVTQATRLIKLITPLGEDVLLLDSFQGQESVSQLFSFELELLSEYEVIDFKKIIGQRATLIMEMPGGEERYLSGHISRFRRGSYTEGFFKYGAQLVPWLWFLTRVTNSRIFQNKTVPDIIEHIFNELGLRDYRLELSGIYKPRLYCVQYRESDLNFISRLMEDEGIFYFFEHKEDKHVLVLGDSPSAWHFCPGPRSVRYHRATAIEAEDTVTEWLEHRELRAGKLALKDFNFETPRSDLSVSVDSLIQVGGNASFELYDFPGVYDKRDLGDRYAKLRMEEEEAQHQIFSGEGVCRGFTSGHRFTLSEHPLSSNNQAYALIAIHHAGANNYQHQSGPHATYANRFTCILDKAAYRPPRLTPKPTLTGSQTAIVVGPSGEEIYTDKYGRVKVQFHWDREGKYDEKSSCWVRVSHHWAGKNWGTFFIPRIGQEVVVSFLEGDPDQPLITGSVYNAEEMPPYELPANQTRAAIKSMSSKGGGGFNEIRIEDKKGSEQVFIHGERNFDLRVKNDAFEYIGNERHLIIKKDHFEQVDGDQHLSLKGDLNEKVDGTASLKTGMDLQQKVGMKYALDAGMEIHLKGGVNVVIEAGTTLTLKVGGNFVNINPGGIFIKGTLVMINSGGAAGSSSGASPGVPSPVKEADTAKPGAQSTLPPPPRPPKPVAYSPAALVMKEAAKSGTPFCEICGQ
jgi:type VI secretion system secreted protein VgrG